MPTTIVHGIEVYADGDYLDEVKVGRNIEHSKRRGTNGVFKKSKTFNPTNDISIKGGGSSGLALGVATLNVTGLGGGIKVVTKDENTQHNSEFDDFDASVEHLPGASAQA
jgi:hypothetical protein